MLDLLEKSEVKTAPPKQWRGVFRCVLAPGMDRDDAFEEVNPPDYIGNNEWRERDIFPTSEAAEQYVVRMIKEQTGIIIAHMATGVILEFPKFVRAEPAE